MRCPRRGAIAAAAHRPPLHRSSSLLRELSRAVAVLDRQPVPALFRLAGLLDQEPASPVHGSLPPHSDDPVCLTGLTRPGTRVKGHPTLDPLTVTDHQWQRPANRSGGGTSSPPSLQPDERQEVMPGSRDGGSGGTTRDQHPDPLSNRAPTPALLRSLRDLPDAPPSDSRQPQQVRIPVPQPCPTGQP